MTDIYSAITRDHDHHRTLLDPIAETTGDSQKRCDA